MAARAHKRDEDKTVAPIDPAVAVAAAAMFGRRGAAARLKSTTPEQRSADARKAANTRWHGGANGRT